MMVWTVPPITLNPGETFDLKTTLPAGYNFFVAAGTLPPGTTLSPDGVITAGTTAGTVTNLQFGATVSTVRANVSTKKSPLPAGVVAQGDLKFVLIRQSDGVVVNTILSQTSSVDFPNVPPGNYRITVQRLDNQGANLGASAFVDFNVPETEFDEVVSVTATLI